MNWFYVDMDSLIESYHNAKEEEDIESHNEDCINAE